MPVATTPHTLSRRDRCDRCGAQAYVRANLPDADGMALLFCNHHFRRHELALVAAGAEILDERHRLDEDVRTPEA